MAGTRLKNLLLLIFFAIIVLIYTHIDLILYYVPASPQKISVKTAQSKVTKHHLKNIETNVNKLSGDNKQSIKVTKSKVSEKIRKQREQDGIEKATTPLSWSAKCSSKIYLLILVISHPKNADRRTAIRGSWGDTYLDDHTKLKKLLPFQHGAHFAPQHTVKVVFVSGTSDNSGHMEELRGESKLYQDIVVGGLQESYKNLTLKTILALKWAGTQCKSTFVVKTDDDVFMNPVMLVEWLKLKPTWNFYTGWCNYNSIPVRDPNSKWYVSYEQYPGERYPGYCLGGGYLMSIDVLERFLKMNKGRTIFPMEDLHVGLIIKEMGDVIADNQAKHFNLVYGGGVAGCDINKLFLAHQVFPARQSEHIKSARKAMVDCP